MLARSFGAHTIDIADGNNIGIAALLQAFCVVCAAISGADDAEADPFIGSRDAELGERGSGRSEKSTACRHDDFPLLNGRNRLYTRRLMHPASDRQGEPTGVGI